MEISKEIMRSLLKKAIDEHSCKEILEVGFRRGVEWFVFESDFTMTKELLARIEYLERENKNLTEAIHRQVQN